MPHAMAFWASLHFMEKSLAENWYLTLTPDLKERMKQDYAAFIETIYSYFLGTLGFNKPIRNSPNSLSIKKTTQRNLPKTLY